MLVISAPSGDNNGDITSYIYKGAIGWQLQDRFYGTENERFGNSLSFSADATRITVGAPNAMGGIGRLGVYDFKDGRWELVGESIFGDNPGANFGGDSGMTIMSGDGSRFIVGANLDNEGGTNAGIARVFEIKDRCEAIDTIEVIENPDSPVDPTDPCAGLYTRYSRSGSLPH